jgi:hypothetical protein
VDQAGSPRAEKPLPVDAEHRRTFDGVMQTAIKNGDDPQARLGQSRCGSRQPTGRAAGPARACALKPIGLR